MDSKPVTNPAAATRGSRRTNRAADATYTRPGLDMDRISFTVLATTAADTVTTATAVIPRGAANLLGCIGRALLGNLLPARKGQRTRPRTRKSRNSKYQARTGPHLTQTYTVDTTITIFEKGLAARSRRQRATEPTTPSSGTSALPNDRPFAARAASGAQADERMRVRLVPVPNGRATGRARRIRLRTRLRRQEGWVGSPSCPPGCLRAVQR